MGGMIGVTLLTCLFLARGQSTDEKNPDQDLKFSANADLVLLDVSVKDTKGGFASNLKKENFQIYENGKRQTISQFGKEDTPITVGLVLDDSRSMKPKRVEVINSALAFINESNPRDEMFVTHFNDRVHHGLPVGTTFTDDTGLLRQALWNNPAQGMTALYDGILDALHQLDSGKQDKKSLVIISDGGDNASAHQFKDVLYAVQSTRAILYTVGVFDLEDPDRNPGLLRRLASISGGVAYIPQHLEELEEICRGIAKDIRNRYSIGYVPVRGDDKSAIRTIRVSITDAGSQKFVVHARTSYSLPARP
jgi:Ca-activated chloride channel family protein